MSIVIGNKTVAGIHIANKEVQRITIGGKVAYEKGPDYFYIKNEYNGLNTITLKKNGSPTTGTTLEWSGDLVTWTTVTYNADNEFLIGIPYQNQKIYFRSTDGFSSSNTSYYTISCSENFSAGGSIYTLINYNNPNLSALPDCCCRSIFKEATKLVSISNIDISNITSVGIRGFAGAFIDCSSLVDVFDTSSITLLSDNAFAGACQRCSSLVECFNLSSVTTVGNSSLNYLYSGCSNLQIVISPNISTWTATTSWVEDVAATGTFVNTSNASIPTGTNGIPSGWVEVMNPNYFRIVNEYAGTNTISLTKTGAPTDITLDYSTDNGSTWTTWSSANGNLSVTLAQGEKVMFKGDNATFSSTQSNYFTFSSTQNYSIKGDLVSLFDSAITTNALPNNCFFSLFLNNTNLIDASNAVISATNFGDSSCKNTFKGCTSLTSAPAFTVNSTDVGSCNGMFDGATSLSNVDNIHLDAINLAMGAYKIMFKGTAITTAPEIMATSIYGVSGAHTNGSLSYMFYNCSNLRTIKVHFTDWKDGNGTFDWVLGVQTVSGDFYNMGNVSIPTGVNGIPSGWTEHTTL